MTLSILVAVTHLLGVGHLTRAAALARAFARAGHRTILVSGGRPAPLVRTDGLETVQLPPVCIAGTDFRTLLDESGQPTTPSRLEARRDMLTGLIEETRPDVVVTELFPFGRRALAGEFMAIVEQARATRPDALVLASIRDILVAPVKPHRIARTHEVLARFYDAVLVHGDANLVPIEASWPLDESTRALIRYTGLVDDSSPSGVAPDGGEGEIVVSGGGSAASLPLYRAALAAAELLPETRWRVLVGAGVTEAEFADLRRTARPHVTVERARPDFRSLLAGATASVSQAGYNTVVDVLRTGVRAVFVPFEQGNESEQRLRAERLAALGVAEVIPEADLSPAILAEGVNAVLRRPRPARPVIVLDGTERSVAIVEELATQRFGSARPQKAGMSSYDWQALDEALSLASERGATIRFWWRDDDAVAHTPQLDRLLALARGLDVPIALAAVPAKVEPSLVARLGGEPLARVLVHGLAHANEAPGGAKKAEFGSHRAISQLADGAAEGLRLARRHFGDLLVPVFVPPWNRIAPELVERLPRLGFRGLSTFGERRTPFPAAELVQVNAHVDPVAWHDGRSLGNTVAILAELARTIAARPGSGAGDAEPIGLLTHHLAHDEPVWDFCERLLERLVAHPNACFAKPAEMFAGAEHLSWNGHPSVRSYGGSDHA